MGSVPLPLSDICDITVTISPAAFAAPQYNQGLVIGPTLTLTTYGGRIQQFTATNWATAMIAAGFTVSSPEYIAMSIYFGQTPAPSYGWVGVRDLTAVQTVTLAGRTVNDGAMSSITNPTYLTSLTGAFVAGDVGSTVRVAGAGAAGADLVTTVASITSPTVCVLVGSCTTTVTAAQTSLGFVGSGYKAGDTITPTQGSSSGALLSVLTVGSAGQVLTLGITAGAQGTGYSVASALPTTTSGSGSGLKVNITVIGETLVQAAEACRLASSVWWAYMGCSATDADHLANAAWASPQWQSVFYFGSSVTPAIAANNITTDVASQMKALEYKAFGVYGTTQSALYPNNIYEAAAVMGVAMGLNTGLANSFFTLGHKSLEGIATEPLTQTQYSTVTGKNFNVYANFSPYQMLEQGRCSDGNPFYLYLFTALLVANMQYNVMNLLSGSSVVPQDNNGQAQLLHAANQACDLLASMGFIAGGTWEGATITVGNVTITQGMALPSGYQNLSAPYSQQSSGDRAAGKSMPIYCLIITAGAVQSVLIGVNVQL